MWTQTIKASDFKLISTGYGNNAMKRKLFEAQFIK